MVASLPLELLLTLKDQASEALEKTTGGMDKLKGIIAGLGIAAAGAMVVDKLKEAGEAAAEEEAGIAKLAAAVKASGADR